MMRKFWPIFFLLVMVLSASCAKKEEVKAPPPFDPEATFAKANQLIEKKQYEEARRELDIVRGRDTSLKYAPLAYLRIADTYILEKEYDRALSQYKGFIDLYPAHKYASYAQYQMGMTYFEQIGDAERGQQSARQALEEFKNLNRRYPRNPYREAVGYYIDKCRNILAEHVFMVGEFYFKKKAFESAIGRYLELLDEYPDFRKKDEAFFHLGVSYLKTGDSESARMYFDKLLTEYPDSKLAEEAKKELARASGKKG